MDFCSWVLQVEAAKRATEQALARIEEIKRTTMTVRSLPAARNNPLLSLVF